MPRHPRRLIAAICLVAVTMSITGCGGGSSAGHATPEACFAAMQTAAKNKDMAGICDCLTDESQTAMSGMLVLIGRMLKFMPHNPEDAAEQQQMADAMHDVLKKHDLADAELANAPQNPQSLGDPKTIRELGALVKDNRAFIIDMFTAIQQFEQASVFSEQFDQQAAGKLHDVKTEGDIATAIVTTAAGTDEPIEFRRTNATGWRLHINLDQGAPAA